MPVVYRLCQCSLFKQFTTYLTRATHQGCCLSIMSMFSFQAIHNETVISFNPNAVVYRLCQCSLFKQFTTQASQQTRQSCCLSIMSMFSFQAIHNLGVGTAQIPGVVYRLCQCSLFKQFTTSRLLSDCLALLFIDYVNVLFSSNSQRTISFYFSMQRYDFFRTVPNLFFKRLKDKHFTF